LNGKGRAPGVFYDHMPHGKDPLSDEQIETIKIWIDEGAVQ